LSYGHVDEFIATTQGTLVKGLGWGRTGAGARVPRIVFGLLEREGSRLFNACVLVGRDGVQGIYRKVHLPFLGVDMFVDPGDLAFAVHELEGLRIGMHICYDGALPETARILTRLGADIDPVRSRTKHLVRVPDRHEVNRFADRRPGFYGPLVAPNGRS
jgi:Carbon-nitrogen hydrolase